MGILRFVIAGFVVVLLGQPTLARKCVFKKGEDRWQIKTSLPQGALSSGPIKVDLTDFMKLTNPTMTAAQKRAIAEKLWPNDVELDGHILHEGDLIQVDGYLYRARCQRDGDYHLEIGASSTDRQDCLIVELPDKNRIADDILKSMVKMAIDELNERAPAQSFRGKGNPVPITVTGQLFLDAHHLSKKKGNPSGGRGSVFNKKHCATNVWEIHPITHLSIDRQLF